MSATVVVTGAAGFIGSHTVHALLDAGWEVVGVDGFTPSYDVTEKRANAAAMSGRAGLRLVEGDLVDLPLAPLLAGASAVVHLAAQAGVTGSWGGAFAGYVHDNVLATQRLLEACVDADIPQMVVASSSSVYGDAPSYPCRETEPPRPVSPYGVTKLAVEHLCQAYARPEVSGLHVTMLRFFTVYGPRQRPDMALRRFLEAAITGREVKLYGDGEQTRDFTFVSDAVRAVTQALESPLRSEVLNVGGGERVTVNHALDLISQVTGRTVRVVHEPSRKGDARDTGADCSRARALIGYRPEVDLLTGLAAEAAWLGSRPAVPASRSKAAPAPFPAVAAGSLLDAQPDAPSASRQEAAPAGS